MVDRGKSIKTHNQGVIFLSIFFFKVVHCGGPWNGVSKMYQPPAGDKTWAEFVVGSHLCAEGFSPGCPVFLNTTKFQFDLESVGLEEPLCGRCHCKFPSIYYFFYLIVMAVWVAIH